MNTKELDKQYVAGTYNRFPLEIVSGKGSVVKDADGKEYIDMAAGIAVTSFGLADDVWLKAVTDQASKLQHMSNLYYTQPCAKLAEMLCERTGMRKVFFSNSGAEANECAIKVARKYGSEKKGPDCYTIVTLDQSFHGRTITTLSATGQEHFHELFTPITPGFGYIVPGNMDQLKMIAAEKKIAGIMIECVQGEGGVRTLDKEFVKALAEFAIAEDIVLIVDEVQTGNGRTGSLYAYMEYDICPDVVTTAKGLAGGLPLAATMLGEKVQDVLGAGDNGSTFGGNPVCSAAAISVLERIDDKLLDEVKEKSSYIFRELEGADGVEEVTGMGLMIGIKTKKTAADVVRECMEKGVLVITAKDKVRLLPALNIPMELIKKAVDVIRSSI